LFLKGLRYQLKVKLFAFLSSALFFSLLSQAAIHLIPLSQLDLREIISSHIVWFGVFAVALLYARASDVFHAFKAAFYLLLFILVILLIIIFVQAGPEVLAKPKYLLLLCFVTYMPLIYLYIGRRTAQRSPRAPAYEGSKTFESFYRRHKDKITAHSQESSIYLKWLDLSLAGSCALFMVVFSFSLSISVAHGDISRDPLAYMRYAAYLCLAIQLTRTGYHVHVLEKIKDDLAHYYDLSFYESARSLVINQFINNKMLESAARTYKQDLFTGKYKDVLIYAAYAHTVQNPLKTSDMFSGYIVDLIFPETFDTKIVILEQEALKKDISDKSRGLSSVNLVYPEFEKYLEAFSDDQVKSRQVITPDVLAALTDLDGFATGLYGVHFVFTGRNIMMCLPRFVVQEDLKTLSAGELPPGGAIQSSAQLLSLLLVLIDALTDK
jgi:hypothetical protein